MILKSIDEAGEIAQCQYAREFGIAVETLSRRFASLRRKGWIEMRVGQHAEHVYALTDKGHQVLFQALPYWERAQQRLRTALGESDWRSLQDLCDRTSRAARQAEQFRTKNIFHSSSSEEPELGIAAD